MHAYCIYTMAHLSTAFNSIKSKYFGILIILAGYIDRQWFLPFSLHLTADFDKLTKYFEILFPLQFRFTEKYSAFSSAISILIFSHSLSIFNSPNPFSFCFHSETSFWNWIPKKSVNHSTVLWSYSLRHTNCWENENNLLEITHIDIRNEKAEIVQQWQWIEWEECMWIGWGWNGIEWWCLNIMIRYDTIYSMELY